MSATNRPTRDETSGRAQAWPVWALAGGQLALHLAAAGRYGWFRDELYSIACSRHLACGYVDQPPLTAFLVWVVRDTLGDSLLAMRLPAAIAMATVVVLCGQLARMLGGGRFAQALAALAACLSPAFLVMGSILTMNPFDILWWTLAMVVLVALLQRERPSLWLLLGAIFGIAALTKLNVAFFAGALLCGVLMTRRRRWLVQPWPWIAVAIALVVALPYLIWQQTNGWPTLEFLRNIRADKNYPVSPFEFVAMQFAVVHPMIFPVWVAGLIWLLRAKSAQPYRLFGWAYVALFTAFCVLQAKFYYLFSIYPVLFAAGGVAIERLTATRNRRRWRTASVVLITVTTMIMIPLTVPILPFGVFLRYNALLDIQRHLRFERGRDRRLPIIYSDMLGWPELADAVANGYAQLPKNERERTTILTENYGQAAAIDFFGRTRHLPPARSGHNAYHDWGPGDVEWSTVIAVGFHEPELQRLFASVESAGVVEHDNAREQSIPIHLCRNSLATTADTWRELQHFK